jgi:hypothetical protein
MDAATLIRDLEPFQQARPVWDRAAEMVLFAATTLDPADVAETTRQLLVALECENWWKATKSAALAAADRSQGHEPQYVPQKHSIEMTPLR